MLKRIFSISLAFCFLAASPAFSASKPVKLKIGTVLAPTFTIVQEMRAMGDRIMERTGGNVAIEVYDNSVLGSESQMYESVYMGTQDMVLIAIASQHISHPELSVEDLPYMFKTREDGYRALDGKYGQAINDIIAKSGEVRNLGFFEMGLRHITNSTRPIVTPEDIKGIKIRVAPSDLRLAVFEQLGAQPIAMSWGEVFSALQQKVVEGQESPLTTIYSSSLYDVQKYLSLSGHFWTNVCVLINEQVWKSIPADHQKIIEEEVKKTGDAIRRKNIEDDATLAGELRGKGMEIVEVDKDAFMKILQPVFDKWEKEVIGKELMDAYREYSGY